MVLQQICSITKLSIKTDDDLLIIAYSLILYSFTAKIAVKCNVTLCMNDTYIYLFNIYILIYINVLVINL